MASHAVQVHLTADIDGEPHPPLMPQLLSALAPALPNVSSVAPLADVRNGVVTLPPAMSLTAIVPGWQHVRLLAPCAELRLLAVGRANLLDVQRLSYLGEALRALLVVEARSLRLEGMTPTNRVPGHLPRSCGALHCDVRTESGATTRVVLGGPGEGAWHGMCVCGG